MVAGVAFAYAPFRATMNGHLHVLSSGGIPLSLFLLLRGYRRRVAWLVLAGWVVVAWQLSLGFTLGLQLAYLLAVLAVVAVVLWFRRGRAAVGRWLIAATAAGVLLAAAVTVYEARPYLRVHRDYPSARRTNYDVGLYSASPRAFLAAPAESRLWGGATAAVRNGLRSRNEDTLFPGLAIFGLAALGLGWGAWPRALRIGLGAGVVTCAVLSLGFGMPPHGDLTYRLLYRFAPGWDAVRTPGRIVTLTSLGLALLAAAGAEVAIAASTRRLPVRWQRTGALAVGSLLVAAVVVDGVGRVGDPRVPLPPPGQARLGQPQLHLPSNGSYDRLYQLWSTDGFPAIVNGVSTFDLPSQDSVRGVMRTFPDAQSVLFLRQRRIRTVVLHTGLGGVGLPRSLRSPPLPADPVAAAAKSIRGLLLRRRTIPGGVRLYRPAPSSRRRPHDGGRHPASADGDGDPGRGGPGRARRPPAHRDARPAELLVRRGGHRAPRARLVRGDAGPDPPDRVDAPALLRRGVGLGARPRDERGGDAVALGPGGDRDGPPALPGRAPPRRADGGLRRRGARGGVAVSDLVLAGGARVRAGRAPVCGLPAVVSAGAGAPERRTAGGVGRGLGGRGGDPLLRGLRGGGRDGDPDRGLPLPRARPGDRRRRRRGGRRRGAGTARVRPTVDGADELDRPHAPARPARPAPPALPRRPRGAGRAPR